MPASRVVRIATRGSALARWQADHVADLLRAAHGDAVEVELVVVETSGDRRLDVPIWEIGGKGVFVKEVQAAVLEGRADLAVHSAKDLPALTAPGLVIAAVPERADPRDALVGSTLDALPPGAVVATGSVRRRAQLAWLRPDLTFAELRGNMATRLAKAEGFAAGVMAVAALDRLGLADRISEVLEPDVLLPQVGQGTLAVEARAGTDAEDETLRERLAAIDHPASRLRLEVERGFLAELGGDCDLPAGAYATLSESGTEVTVEGLIASLDGHVVLRRSLSAPRLDSSGPPHPEPELLGRHVARHLLDRDGGAALLDR
jgi:hydroxymethylbilane synthase